MPCKTNLATTTALNAKINEVKNKIPNTTNSANTAALTAVENEIPMFVIQSKKLTITQKLMNLKVKLLLINHDYDKYITTQEFNK